jgi:hypothetical protein
MKATQGWAIAAAALLGGPAGLISQPQEVGEPRADSISV